MLEIIFRIIWKSKLLQIIDFLLVIILVLLDIRKLFNFLNLDSVTVWDYFHRIVHNEGFPGLFVQLLYIFLYFVYFCIDLFIARIQLLHFFVVIEGLVIVPKLAMAVCSSQIAFEIGVIIAQWLVAVSQCLGSLINFHVSHSPVGQYYAFELSVLLGRLLFLEFLQTLAVGIYGLLVLTHFIM